MSEEQNDDEQPSDAQREMEILTAWALRFDGYAYESAEGLVLHEASTAYVDHGRLPDDPLGRLAVLFALQRWLGKWGGEGETQHGRTWRRFRDLFLSTTNIDVPDRYRADGYYEDWQREWRPRFAGDVAFVRKIHTETRYDEDAEPTL